MEGKWLELSNIGNKMKKLLKAANYNSKSYQNSANVASGLI